jgi:hypothetical protein
MHCGEAQGDTTGLRAPHAVLLAVQWCGRVSLSGLWLKLNWEAPMGSDLVYYSVSSGTLIRPASTRFVIGLRARLFRNRFVQVGVYGGGWIYGGWIWS